MIRIGCTEYSTFKEVVDGLRGHDFVYYYAEPSSIGIAAIAKDQDILVFAIASVDPFPPVLTDFPGAIELGNWPSFSVT